MNIYNVLIFGTGSLCEKVIRNLSSNCNVIGYIDNNKTKINRIFKDKHIISPNEIKRFNYDFILIASQSHTDIYNQLLNLNIDKEKIIPVLYNKFIRDISKKKINILNDILYKKNINKDKSKIALVSTGDSSCNCKALYKLMPEYLKLKYNVKLIDINDETSEFDLIITTHLNMKLESSKINIDLWHGFPLKSIGMMNPYDASNNKDVYENNKALDFIFSLSKTFSIIFNGCVPLDYSKYVVTGSPRNDLLFLNDNFLKIDNVFHISKYNKVIIYLPTYRRNISQNTIELEGENFENDIFNFSQKYKQEFINFLNDNNYLLLIKPHQYSPINFKDTNNIKLINDTILNNNNIGLYELLSKSDMLITDYSSVYFDFLLTNKPILFVNNDIDIYNNNRGFLFNYEKWTPGEKVSSYSQLINQIKKIFSGCDKFIDKRKFLCDLIHDFKDGNSCKRVWNKIDKIISEYRY